MNGSQKLIEEITFKITKSHSISASTPTKNILQNCGVDFLE